MGVAIATALAVASGIVCGGATGFVFFTIALNPSGKKETDKRTALAVGTFLGTVVAVPAATAGFAVGYMLPFAP